MKDINCNSTHYEYVVVWFLMHANRWRCIFLPLGCKPEQQMMYSGSMKSLVSEVGITKVST